MPDREAQGCHEDTKREMVRVPDASIDIGCNQLVGATPFLRVRHATEQLARSSQWKIRQQHPDDADGAKP